MKSRYGDTANIMELRKTGWQKGRQDVRPDVELQLGLKPGGSGVGLVTPFCLGARARMLSTGINDE